MNDERDDPFARLERSHRRLEQELDVLRDASQTGDVATLREVVAFLSRQVARHEEDEEASLFPRLTRLAPVDGLESREGGDEVRALIVRLAEDHRAHEELAARLGQAIDAGDDEEIRTVAEAVVRAYDAHIALEERDLFPRARTLLSTAEQDAIAEEMQARRRSGGGGGGGRR